MECLPPIDISTIHPTPKAQGQILQKRGQKKKTYRANGTEHWLLGGVLDMTVSDPRNLNNIVI